MMLNSTSELLLKMMYILYMKSEENKKVCTLRNSGGLRKTPTPGGVPVRMMSPGFKVMNLIKDRHR